MLTICEVNMKFNKKAFTLTELLIAVGVVGVLAVILMPVITNMMPDQNAIMAKRAYYTVQNVVSDMINNGECYPDTSKAADDSVRRIGFDDGYYYPNCENWKLDDADHFYTADVCEKDDSEEDGCKKDSAGNKIILHHKGDPKEGDASLKFSKIFQLSLIDKADNEFNTEQGKNRFTTKDGIDWHFSNLEFFDERKNNPEACAIVYVDVNGAKGPDRMDTGDAEEGTIFGRTIKRVAYDSDDPATYDVFSMDICSDGKVNIRDEWANRVIDVDYNLQGEN